MCSICGGTRWDEVANHIWESSTDRGRDAHGRYVGISGSWIGNHRATPTTEIEFPIEGQPVGDTVKLVFNGIISNADDLGIQPGEADTSVLPRVLNFDNLSSFRRSISINLKGSYAIAARVPSGHIWLAANYKPIWIGTYDGQWYFSSLASHFPFNIIPYRMRPYGVQDLQDFSTWRAIPRFILQKVAVIASAGLDSTAVAAMAVKQYGAEFVTLLHFDYGCNAGNKEKEQITKIAQYLGISLVVIPMTSYGGSSLLRPGSEISEGIAGAEYAHEWVPARNLLMLANAVAYAEANKVGRIFIGTNLEEAGAYPDNEEQFILDFDALLTGAVQNGVLIKIVSPLGGLMKHEIVPFGIKYNAPFHLTWSCYKGGDKHCGKCGPCFMRQTAFKRNGLIDPVEYESN